MQKTLAEILIGFVSFLILCPGFNAQAAEKTILARFSIQFPPKHHLVRAANLFAKTAGEKSQGSIKVQVFPMGQLYKEDEVIDAVRSKSVEIADILPQRWAGIDRIFDVFGSNLYVITGYELTWMVADGKPGAYLAELMKKYGCYPIFCSCSGVYQGITNSKRPLIKWTDCKGLLIRTATGPYAELFQLYGASPVVLSGGEVYDTMQRKTVDAGETSLASILDRKYYEVQKYLTITMNHPSYHYWIVNWNWWNDLPKEKRDILQQSALIAQAWSRKELARIEADYTQKLQKLMITYIQTESEAEESGKSARPLAENWLKATGAEGKKLLDLIYEVKRGFNAQRKK
jgi:TRAP-type C4-dicarboxylate transport system substrate-binding protein